VGVGLIRQLRKNGVELRRGNNRGVDQELELLFYPVSVTAHRLACTVEGRTFRMMRSDRAVMAEVISLAI